MITGNAQLAAIRVEQEKFTLAIAANEIKTRNVDGQTSPNSPAMATFSPTTFPESSNHTSVNSTRAELSILPVETPPSILPLDKLSEKRVNQENTTIQHFQESHGHGSTEPHFAPAPPTRNTPPPSPPFQYPPRYFSTYKKMDSRCISANTPGPIIIKMLILMAVPSSRSIRPRPTT